MLTSQQTAVWARAHQNPRTCVLRMHTGDTYLQENLKLRITYLIAHQCARSFHKLLQKIHIPFRVSFHTDCGEAVL